jgi:hypothetical protein
MRLSLIEPLRSGMEGTEITLTLNRTSSLDVYRREVVCL